MKQLEHAEQVTLLQWWGMVARAFDEPEASLFAIPNGGERNVIVAAKLKAEGVRAGVPDLFLAVRRRDYAGLFIEMKKEHGGRVSASQSSMIEMLSGQGYKAIVCHGWIEAKDAIERYLKER